MKSDFDNNFLIFLGVAIVIICSIAGAIGGYHIGGIGGAILGLLLGFGLGVLIMGSLDQILGYGIAIFIACFIIWVIYMFFSTLWGVRF